MGGSQVSAQAFKPGYTSWLRHGVEWQGMRKAAKVSPSSKLLILKEAGSIFVSGSRASRFRLMEEERGTPRVVRARRSYSDRRYLVTEMMPDWW